MATSDKPTSIGNDQDRLVAALSYLVFFLPLVMTPESKFGRYHANQGLLLLIFTMVTQTVGVLFPIIGWFIILPLSWLMTVILFLVGLTNALAGKQKPLPIIGNFELLK